MPADRHVTLCARLKAIIDELLERSPAANLDGLGQAAINRLHAEFPDLTVEELVAVADAAEGFWSRVH